ncbi:hypothetical protein Hanom_Chr10g00910461 [Helianthus anomalus]
MKNTCLCHQNDILLNFPILTNLAVFKFLMTTIFTTRISLVFLMFTFGIRFR